MSGHCYIAAMACPQCGGQSRRQIAPGFYECTTELQISGYAPVPGATGAPVPLQPHFSVAVCGNQYQEASPAPGTAAETCSCSVFAIGRCSRCSTPLCGHHLYRVQGTAFCGTHAAAEKAERAKQQVDSMREGYTTSLERCADWVMRAAQATPERFLLLTHWGPVPPSFHYVDNSTPGQWNSADAACRRAVDRVTREVFNSTGEASVEADDLDPRKWKISPGALAEWVYSRHANLPTKKIKFARPVERLALLVPRPVFGVLVHVVEPDGQGWSTSRRYKYLTPDGRVIETGDDHRAYESEQKTARAPIAASQISKLISALELPVPPDPRFGTPL